MEIYWARAMGQVGAQCSTCTISLNDGHLSRFTAEETEAQRAKWLVLGDTARKGQSRGVN